MSPVAMAQSSSGIAIRYVFPVLWMMSRLSVMGRMAYFNTGAEFDVDERLISHLREAYIFAQHFFLSCLLYTSDAADE